MNVQHIILISFQSVQLTGSIDEPGGLRFPIDEDTVHGNARQNYNYAYTYFPWRDVAWEGDQECADYEEDDW